MHDIVSWLLSSTESERNIWQGLQMPNRFTPRVDLRVKILEIKGGKNIENETRLKPKMRIKEENRMKTDREETYEESLSRMA